MTFTQDDIAQDHIWIDQWRSVCIAFIVLNTFFVVLRIISRKLPSKSVWGWDDTLIIPAWMASMALLGLNIYAIESNLKSTSPTATKLEAEIQLENTLKGIYGVQITYILAYVLPKISILFLYLRIFPQRNMQRLSWALIIFMIVDGIAYIFPAIFICNPPKAFYTFTVVGKCIDNDAYNRSVPPPNIVTDLIMLIMPIPTVMKLNAPVAKRLGLLFTFFTGSVGTIACIVRWGYFLKYSVHSPNVYITSRLDILAVVEPSVYLIAACLPPLRSLAVHLSPTSLGASLSEIFRSRGQHSQSTELKGYGSQGSQGYTNMDTHSDKSQTGHEAAEAESV